MYHYYLFFFFFFQAEDGIRDDLVTGVQTCALPICNLPGPEGKPGKDADVSEVLELAISKVREEFAKEYKVLEHAILNQLKASQVVDENGKAHPSLQGGVGSVGPAGVPGKNGEPGVNG